MPETIQLEVQLRAFVRREARRWMAVCPSIGVASQGKSSDDAKKSLDEAVQLWFESCIERGTLERALQEVGFRPAPWGEPADVDEVRVTISRGEHEILGDAFQIHVQIPAYQAAALLDTRA